MSFVAGCPLCLAEDAGKRPSARVLELELELLLDSLPVLPLT